MLKFIPEDDEDSIAQQVRSLRSGTDLAKAREAILSAKKPLHLNELLQTIGKEITKKNRASLTGNLGACVRDSKIFTRPAPATYGLIELEQIVEQESVPETIEEKEEKPALEVVN